MELTELGFGIVLRFHVTRTAASAGCSEHGHESLAFSKCDKYRQSAVYWHSAKTVAAER
jgi:hypothetical protein